MMWPETIRAGETLFSQIMETPTFGEKTAVKRKTLPKQGFCKDNVGRMMGLEPTATWATTRCSTN